MILDLIFEAMRAKAGYAFEQFSADEEYVAGNGQIRSGRALWHLFMDLDAMVVSADEEGDVKEQFERAYKLFQEKALPNTEPVMCKLHDAFGTMGTTNHNCLGCSFADSILLLDNFLKTHSLQDSIQYSYTSLLVLSYLLVSRIETLFEIIELNRTYRDENFKILLLIRRWANFLKHPKAFLLTHHPVFSYEGNPNNEALAKVAKVVINSTFVHTYYANEDKNKDLYAKLENQEGVLVIFPAAEKLISGLCEAMVSTVKVISDNPIYREVIAKKTTYLDFYSAPPLSSLAGLSGR